MAYCLDERPAMNTHVLANASPVLPVIHPAIEFDNVSRIFGTRSRGQVTALRDISFVIDRNEFVAFVGPSGCGKSTILRLFAGLIPPSTGMISANGAPVVKPLDKVGIVFQKPTLLPWLDIESNVVFLMRHKYGRVTEQDRRAARELLALVGLSDFARSRPSELSGGMQQRVAIARALLMDPQFLLMDEPFSALDALSREEMSYELQRIWSERPKTVLFITHSISEAVLLADRIVVMTPRPGSIAAILDVPLPRPRGAHSQENPLFSEISACIRSLIFGGANAR
nr:ABC transporter ATP-binding protein [Methylovirgula ligni]